MNIFANGFSLDMLLSLLRRRAWIGIALFTLLGSIAASLIVFLANVYTTQALVLVEGQQIPQDYVRSTVTKVVERRLQEISQDLLSRSKLQELAEQFALYKDLKKDGASSEVIANAMRSDIGLRVINGRGRGAGDAVAFGVSYTSPDPQKAMQVANRLASLYIDANMQRREGDAKSTSDFLAKQVEDTRIKLEEHEAKVTVYRRQHMGELPEQRESNLKMIETLQNQMQLFSDNIARAQERRNMLTQMTALETEFAEVEQSSLMLSTKNDSQTAPTALTPEQQLRILKNQLHQLLVRFSDKHPDVLRLKQIIATVESAQGLAPSLLGDDTSVSATPSRTKDASPSASVRNTISTKSRVASMKFELDSLENQIQRMNEDIQKANSDIVVYQQRVESTPKVEQELISISRDYNTTRDLYTSLLKRLDEAKLADKLEQNQKAEKFRVLEPALFPDKPTAPDRIRLVIMALVFSVGGAVGGMFLREILDSSFHDVDDLRQAIKIPILVTIPCIVTTSDLWRTRIRQGIGALALSLSVVVIIGVMYRVVHGNEQITRSLFRPGVANQLTDGRN
jgi:polysaccharide chain length determinant protein (PEP-CTERM system associated)